MRFICQICGYVYDEATVKTPYHELPDDWKCPLCGAAKSDFREETASVSAPSSFDLSPEEDVRELSAGQLAALCSNLARGCEKQYKPEEASLFAQLADYFTSSVPAVDDATVEALLVALQEDVSAYSSIRASADLEHDRGAARVCVWGEKVTRMLSSLVNRYIKEGEAMLENTSVWVCTTCGFVYIGDEAPALCPVCKVPSRKFDKIEGSVSL